MEYINDKSDVPYLELDDEKSLIVYTMKIKQGDYDLLSDYQKLYNSNKRHSKRQNRSKSNRNKSRSRTARKKHKKNKRNRKKHKKNKNKHRYKNRYLSGERPRKTGSSSYLPIVVLNSDVKTEENNGKQQNIRILFGNTM